jgi:hypothetical protein
LAEGILLRERVEESVIDIVFRHTNTRICYCEAELLALVGIISHRLHFQLNFDVSSRGVLETVSKKVHDDSPPCAWLCAEDVVVARIDIKYDRDSKLVGLLRGNFIALCRSPLISVSSKDTFYDILSEDAHVDIVDEGHYIVRMSRTRGDHVLGALGPLLLTFGRSSS